LLIGRRLIGGSMKLGRYSYLAASTTIGVTTLCLLQGAQAQQAQQPGVAQLPPVNVIQDQPKPAKKPAPKKTVAKKKPPVAPAPVAAQAEPVALPDAGENSVRLSPLAGSEVPLDKVPGAVNRVTSSAIDRAA
jgi:iron complex outermembrane recepter protein